MFTLYSKEKKSFASATKINIEVLLHSTTSFFNKIVENSIKVRNNLPVTN